MFLNNEGKLIPFFSRPTSHKGNLAFQKVKNIILGVLKFFNIYLKK